MRRCAWLLSMLLVACGQSGAPSGGDPLVFLDHSRPGGFEQAVAARAFSFPRDHGPHLQFRSEWWYFTGNLDASSGSFGFQITVFRFGLQPGPAADGWTAHHLWLAQLALTDVQKQRFVSAERLSRGALGLAGADSDRLRVWVEDWRIEASDANTAAIAIVADDPQFGVDLHLVPKRPIVLQGEAGLSRKSATPGNASYYYSMPRLAVSGQLRIGEEHHPVSGLAWMDREWSTSALDDDQQGWDWFSLQLDDGHDLMLYRLRDTQGRMHPFSAGTLIAPDGTPLRLAAEDISAQAQRGWQDASGSRYPVAWRVTGPGFELDVEAVLDDQLHRGRFEYWEGAVNVSGTHAGQPVTGRGYLEMTPYP